MRRVCLFAQYSRDGRLREDTRNYIAALAGCGFSVHVAVSGAARLHEPDRAMLESVGATGHPRDNGGLDFGAWRHLIELGVAADATEILLANDSVIGPFMPLGPMFAEMAGYDAWGMVGSREGRPHLQSWFVWMTAPTFADARVRRVLMQDFGSMAKDEIIVHGELGLGAALDAAGLDLGVRYRSRFSLTPSGLLANNPMHFRWRDLLRERRVPFVKVELLRDNPVGVMGLDRLDETLRELCGDDPRWAAARRAAIDALASGRGRRGRRPRGVRLALMKFAMAEDRWSIIRAGLRGRGRGPGRRRAE